MLAEIRSEANTSSYRQTITTGTQQFFADLPASKGGSETAPDPHQLFYGAWGACTNMTIQLYCQRKGWPVTAVITRFSEERREGQTWVQKQIEVQGPIPPEQQAKLRQIAEKCPVNQLITGDTQIVCQWTFTGQEPAK